MLGQWALEDRPASMPTEIGQRINPSPAEPQAL
jgi:hypothetical protein